MTDPEIKRSLKSRCGPVGALAFTVYRFGNKTVYGSFPKPVRRLRLTIHSILDLVVVRVIASASLPPQIKIGEGIKFIHEANGVIIHPKVVIGNNVTIHQQVTIGQKVGDPRFPKIGNSVKIGAGAKIIGGVTISDYAKVGANAVVVSDVPLGGTAVGVPARIIPPKPGWKPEDEL